VPRSAISDDDVVLVVAHDAGGANILVHLVDLLPGQLYFSMTGPALRIFNERFGVNMVRDRTLESIDQATCLVVGTSELSNDEWLAMRHANETGKPVYAFLDHWINYSQRFVRNGIAVQPTEIWVGDGYAHDLAVAEFPGTHVRLHANPYSAEILREAGRLRIRSADGITRRVLYLTEPAGRIARNLDAIPGIKGYTEFEAVRYFLDNALRAFPQVESLTFRLHPSEESGKYAELLSEFPGMPIVISSATLASDLAHADAVVGTHSNVLAIAISTGIPAITAIPPEGIPCILPQREVARFDTLLD